MPSASVPTRIAGLLVAAIVVSLIGFTLAVVALRDRSNAHAEAESVQLTASYLANLHRDLAGTTAEFNRWDAAFEAMMAGDVAWIYDNYAASVATAHAFDGVVLLGAPFPEPLAWTANAPGPDPSLSHLPSELLARIAREVALLPLGEYATFDAATVVDGRLVLVSAMRTQPFWELGPDFDPAGFPIAAFTRQLDPDDLAALAAALFIDDLSFGAQPVAGLASLPVAGPDGEVLGHLSWLPPRTGSEIVATMAPVLVAAALVFAALGGVAAWLVRAHARHLVREQADAQRAARTDGLTGLPNRLAFAEHLTRLTAARVAQVAVLFLDLNGFKAVNDSLGHAAGDALLAEVAERLARLVGEGAFLARLGGDEFVFVLAGPGGVAARAGRLGQAVSAAIAEPIPVLGEQVRVSASQGLALRNAPDVALDELVRRADLAMYQAKRAGAGAEAGAVRPRSPGPDGEASAALGDDQGPPRALRLV